MAELGFELRLSTSGKVHFCSQSTLSMAVPSAPCSVVQGLEPRTPCMVDKCPTTELHPEHHVPFMIVTAFLLIKRENAI